MDEKTRQAYLDKYENLSSSSFYDFGKFCDERDRLWALANLVCATATVKSEKGTYKVGCCIDYEEYECWGLKEFNSEISNYFDGNVEVSDVTEVDTNEFSKLVGMSIVEFYRIWNKYSRFVKIISTTNETEKRKIERADEIEKYILDHEDELDSIMDD